MAQRCDVHRRALAGLAIGFALTALPASGQHTLTLVNQCTVPIWIGGFSGSGSNAQPLPEPNWGSGQSPSWQIPAGKSRQLTIPACWTAGQLFARTGCVSTEKGLLSCKTGDCGGLENCGTNGKGGDNVTLAEFTMNGGQPQNCTGDDDYDVSMVAGFNLTIRIKPSQPAKGRVCGTAGACAALPACPWGTFIDPGSTGYKPAGAGELGTCLAPSVMASVPLAPFINPAVNTDLVGCGCPPGSSCGTGTGFCCSPFTTTATQKGCIQSFGPSGGCFPKDCATLSGYSAQQICDPYGQCDKALNRQAAWPTLPNGVAVTSYITNIQTACAGAGIYTWAFDDLANIPGLSGGNFTCTNSSGTVGYTLTFACPASAATQRHQPVRPRRASRTPGHS